MKNLKFIALLLLFSTLISAQNIIKMEYWIDSDPGFDAAFPIIGFTQQLDISNYPFVADSTANLSAGIHTIGIRSKDATGQWSHTNFFQLYVAINESPGVITRYEYFWDSDSGFYNCLQHIPSFNVNDTNNYMFDATVPLLGLTAHTFFIRTLDNTGRWSHTNHVTVFVYGTTNVEELQIETGIDVYPNPFSDAINITAKLNKPSRVVLYDENGKLVLDKIINQETKINTETFACGVYTILVWNEMQKIYRSTIMKQ